MNDVLSQALVTLATNPIARREFQNRPEAAAALLNLNPSQTNALVTGDQATIQRSILQGKGVDLASVSRAVNSAASDIEVVIVVVL